DFWATWCGPCMRLLPEMEKMAAEFKGKVLFLKVNADKEKELCSVFNIQALPTLMFIAPGKEMIRDMGASSEKYREIIESLLK
ncbi:MAG: thioredoxin domain-containing protein, partial [Marinifilaceae bacterium]|nr:thioredoxin domain-containing protein [Marinifilaceae bacterium]